MDYHGWTLVIVGIVGVAIASFQWITARQKLALDLFDKRYEAFREVVAAISPALRHAKFTDHEFFAYVNAMERCRFLFGREVYEFLTSLKKDLAFLSAFSDEAIQA